jgi:hypothetical protein
LAFSCDHQAESGIYKQLQIGCGVGIQLDAPFIVPVQNGGGGGAKGGSAG